MDTGDTERGRRWRNALIAAGAAVAMTIAGLGIAAAQEQAPETPEPPPTREQPLAVAEGDRGPGGADRAERRAEGRGPRAFAHKGRFGGGPGHGPGIHGEFTTRAPGGGYQTIATQFGDVTAVTASSLTVKSEDGFTRTYSVDDNTLVNAGNDGIDDVKVGDEVAVVAVVTDGKAAAVDVNDVTRIRASHERWMPGPRKAPAETGD